MGPGALPAPEASSHKWLPSSALPGSHPFGKYLLTVQYSLGQAQGVQETAGNKSDKIPALMSLTHQPGKTHDRKVNKYIHLYIRGFYFLIQ